MSARSVTTSSHFNTLGNVIGTIRVPFQPKQDPNEKLAKEIESCKRKIWECVAPADRLWNLEKKQKKFGKFLPNKENSQSNFNPPLQKTISPVPEISLPQEQPTKSQPKKANPSRPNVEFKVNAMKVVELKKELKARGYETGGLKKDLRARLLDAMLVELAAEGSLILPSSSKTEEPHLNPEVTEKLEDETTNPAEDVRSKEQEFDSVPNDDSFSKREASRNVVTAPHQHEQEHQQEQELFAKNPVVSMQVELNSNDVKESSEEAVQRSTDAPQNTSFNDTSSNLQSHKFASTFGAKPSIQGKVEPKAMSMSPLNEKSIAPFEAFGEPKYQQSADESVPMNLEGSKLIEASSSSDQTSTTSEGKIQAKVHHNFSHVLVPMKLDDGKQEDATDSASDISQPASEASSVSKASGKMVKDMVSKFSGFSGSLSSNSNSGSALSKGLQAKKEARMARMAEIREKSKPATSSKVALTSKEYSTNLSSLNATAATASAKKNNLAAQMREKAAALKKDPTSSNSKLTFGSSHKRHLAFGVQDSLGTTLKQGTSLKKLKVHSPMDTYEISDREDSETDDSDSEAENDKQKKKIPTWAMRANLVPALEQQYTGRIDGRRVDPDDIFPEVQSCDLEAIFGSKKAKYRNRTSSGNWTKDRVTVAEKLVYKRDMGFATNAEVSEV